jgi:hypothetical protein
VQDSIPARVQSIPERIVSRAPRPTLLGCLDAVLLLRHAAELQPLEWQRSEGICRIQPGAPSRVRTAGGDRVGKPEGAFALLSPGPNRQNRLRKRSSASARPHDLPGTRVRAASHHSVKPKTSGPASGSPNHLKNTNRDRDDSGAHCDFCYER